MKKTLLLTLSLLTLSLTSCNSNQNNQNINGDSIIPVEGTKDSTLKELARQTVLGFSSLSNVNANVLAKRELTNDEIIDVKEALKEVDILLNDNNKLVAVEIESDREDYSNALSLSFTMLEKKEDFTLYYNDINVKEERDDDEDDDEIEKETSFKGIAIYNNLEYDFSYETEEEVEDDETESETTFKLFLDKNNFIKIKQGFENERNENELYYSYSLIQDGHQIEEFKFKEEFEDNKHHVELEKNNKTYKINYETKDGEDIIRVALKVNREETAFGYFKRVTVTDENNNTSISYEYIS